MFNINRRRVPLGIMMIASFYLFGAGVLLVSMFTNPVGVSRIIADAHGLSPTIGTWILLVIAALAVLIAFGLLTVSRWGFFLTIIYMAVFGSISVLLMLHSFQQPHIGNATWSLLVLVYLSAKRKFFLRTT